MLHVDALMAKATALRVGLNLAQSFGCSWLIINSDNSNGISAMQDGGTFSGLAAAIFDDCYHMARDLSQVHCEHYRIAIVRCRLGFHRQLCLSGSHLGLDYRSRDLITQP